MIRSMSNRLRLAASVVMVVACSGCENSFSPKGEYQQRLVVYAVISNRSDSQYVRVYTTYNLSGFDPAEHTTDTDVRGAMVTMKDDSATYNLKQTIIPRDDTSRYSTNLVAYYAFPCPLRPGKQYSLAITSDQGNATSTVSVPTHGIITFTNPYVLKTPGANPEPIAAAITLSPIAQGYIVRLYVDFDVYIGQSLIQERLEVPSGTISPGSNIVQLTYPTLEQRPSDSQTSAIFSHDAFVGLLNDLASQCTTFQITGATFILTQVESNLFKYYNIVNGFQDPYSIREDLPDYTNIVGGYGVFGAMVEDSLVVDLR